MQAIQYSKYGGPEVLELVERPNPEPGPGQVLVEIHSASVNPIDWKLRAGQLKLIHPLSLPAIPGYDLAGTVVAMGPGVSKFKIGDEVYSRSNHKDGGACAQLMAIDESVVAHKPKTMSFDEAAAVPLAALTALQALRDKTGLKDGDRVLIHGASGGVGGYAVQIARALVRDAHVVGTCSEKNRELVQSFGAHEVLDYRTTDPLQTGETYDVIFDAVAKLGFGNSKKALKPGGHYVTTLPAPDVILAKIVGNLFSSRKADIIIMQPDGPDLEYLTGLAEAGQLRSVIDSTFPLSETRAAHEQSATGHTNGKIVIHVK